MPKKGTLLKKKKKEIQCTSEQSEKPSASALPDAVIRFNPSTLITHLNPDAHVFYSPITVEGLQ